MISPSKRCHGGEPDVGMRPHIDALPGMEFRGAELVEKDERADHAPARMRQRAAHREMAHIDAARHEHQVDCISRVRIAERRILAGKEAHVNLLSVSLL
jgi:hypothetical protein